MSIVKKFLILIFLGISIICLPSCKYNSSSSILASSIADDSMETKPIKFEVCGFTNCEISSSDMQGQVKRDWIDYIPICPYCGKEHDSGCVRPDKGDGSYKEEIYCYTGCKKSYTIFISWREIEN